MKLLLASMMIFSLNYQGTLRFLPHPPFATFNLITLYMAASVGMTCLFYDLGGE
jgi:hypothetical protein